MALSGRGGERRPTDLVAVMSSRIYIVESQLFKKDIQKDGRRWSSNGMYKICIAAVSWDYD